MNDPYLVGPPRVFIAYPLVSSGFLCGGSADYYSACSDISSHLMVVEQRGGGGGGGTS